MDEKGEINKFSEAEIILGSFYTLGIDLPCLLIDLTGVGLAIAPIIQGGVSFSMWAWFSSKGDTNYGKFGRQVVKLVANVLPLAPTTFIVFLIEVFIHNHPRAAQLTGQTAGTAAGSAIAGPAGARIGGAVGQYAMGGSAVESAASAVGPTKTKVKLK